MCKVRMLLRLPNSIRAAFRDNSCETLQSDPHAKDKQEQECAVLLLISLSKCLLADAAVVEKEKNSMPIIRRRIQLYREHKIGILCRQIPHLSSGESMPRVFATEMQNVRLRLHKKVALGIETDFMSFLLDFVAYETFLPRASFDGALYGNFSHVSTSKKTISDDLRHEIIGFEPDTVGGGYAFTFTHLCKISMKMVVLRS